MSNHYHHASEIHGVADDRHSHSPRDIGAAEAHDLDMLRRDVQRLEASYAELSRQHTALARDQAELIGECQRLTEVVSSLARDLASFTNTVIGAIS